MNIAPINTGINDAIPRAVPIPINQAEKVLPSLVNIIQQITPTPTPIANKTFNTVHRTIAVMLVKYIN
tara:strand:- start:228 stop:431 length:204 start_codon:yes stop_codon:yes gene_type:complete